MKDEEQDEPSEEFCRGFYGGIRAMSEILKRIREESLAQAEEIENLLKGIDKAEREGVAQAAEE